MGGVCRQGEVVGVAYRDALIAYLVKCCHGSPTRQTRHKLRYIATVSSPSPSLHFTATPPLSPPRPASSACAVPGHDFHSVLRALLQWTTNPIELKSFLCFIKEGGGKQERRISAAGARGRGHAGAVVVHNLNLSTASLVLPFVVSQFSALSRAAIRFELI